EKSIAADRDIDDDRLLRPRADALNGALRIFAETDHDLDAATRASRRSGERSIDRRSDADGVDARALRELLENRRHDLLLEADEAVGDEDDLTLRFLPERLQCFEDSLAHFRSAARLQAREPRERGLLVFLR